MLTVYVAQSELKWYDGGIEDMEHFTTQEAAEKQVEYWKATMSNDQDRIFSVYPIEVRDSFTPPEEN